MSHVSADAHHIIGACERYLASRDEKIRLKRQAMIDEAMTTGWKWFRPKTVEEAIKRFQGERWLYSDYQQAECMFGAQKRRVEQLLNLAKLALYGDGYVPVNAELASDLASFLET